jgi:hypothetical protein
MNESTITAKEDNIRMYKVLKVSLIYTVDAFMDFVHIKVF